MNQAEIREARKMKFRPCIDIHNGKVKQIVGGSLQDDGDLASTNFASELGADYYAEMYRKDHLTGGHIILLNHAGQIGGGVTAENAAGYLKAGASHVIVTSYVFRDGALRQENLDRLVSETGKEHIVLDLSCRMRGGDYYVVTDRWQKFTDLRLSPAVLDELSGYCDEFLIHGVDVEGKRSGMEEELVRMLGEWQGIPVTYAGGMASLDDVDRFGRLSGGRLDYTIGSALDLFGGNVPYQALVRGVVNKK